jgi:hypothetical protein
MDRVMKWFLALFAEPPSPLPAHLQRPWTDAECRVIALHMSKVTPW